jgi:uncharacterized BrkB/YihY/UPF0761 family membrane protein
LAWAAARNGRPLDVEAKNAKAFMTSWWALTKEAAARVNHKDAQLGAALAYYSIFSLGPLMVIAIAIVGLVFGQEAFAARWDRSSRGLVLGTDARSVVTGDEGRTC